MPQPAQPIYPVLLSSRHKRAIIISLLLAATLYLVIVISAGYQQIIQAIQRMNPLIWSILLLSSLLNYVVRFIRWQFFLRQFGYQLPGLQHFVYYLAGFALTTTPGKAGEVIRSVLLHPRGVRFPHSIAAFFTERLLDIIVVALLALGTFSLFENYTFIVASVCAVLVVGLTLLRCRRCHAWCRAWQHRLHHTRLRRWLGVVVDLLGKSRRLLAWKIFYVGMGFGLLAWSLQGLAFSFLLQHFAVTVSLWAALGIYATSLLIGAISFLPGGVGSTEVTMYLLLKSTGVDDITAITLPLISRLSTLWFAVSLGMLSTAYLTRQN
ncbi:MAG: flippase-like domain-containing protein [Gammaproteobacteria bacterium]|nr:flippase-like domain-containing protein [Gammaproteobacteria bacterium]